MIDKKLQEQEGKGTAVLWNKGFKAYVHTGAGFSLCGGEEERR